MAKYEDPNQLDYRNGGDTVDDFAQKYMRTIAYVFKALNDLRTPTGNTAGVEPEPYMWRIADNKLYIRNGDNTDYVLLGEISPNFGFRQSVNDKFLTTADLEGDGAVVTRNEAGKVEGDITGSPGKIANKTIDVTPSADNDVIAYDAAQQKWVKKTLNDYLKKQGDAGWDEMVDEVADQVIEDITPIIFNFWYLDDDRYLVPLVGSTEGGLPSIHGMVGDYEQITARSVDVAGNINATGNVTASMVTTPQANVTTLTANAVNAGTVTANDIIAKGPVVDVRAFGAVGDGVHDDTVAIQRAIDNNPGSSIVFPDGIYLVSSSIVTSATDAEKTPLYFLGNATIKASNSFPANSYILDIGGKGTVISGMAGNPRKCGVYGGRFVGNSSNTYGGIRTKMGGVILQNIYIEAINNYGVMINSPSDTASSDIYMDLIYITGTGTDDSAGLFVAGYDNKISRVRTYGFKHGIHITGGGNYVRVCHPLGWWSFNGDFGSGFYDDGIDNNYHECYSDGFDVAFETGANCRRAKVIDMFSCYGTNRGGTFYKSYNDECDTVFYRANVKFNSGQINKVIENGIKISYKMLGHHVFYDCYFADSGYQKAIYGQLSKNPRIFWEVTKNIDWNLILCDMRLSVGLTATEANSIRSTYHLPGAADEAMYGQLSISTDPDGLGVYGSCCQRFYRNDGKIFIRNAFYNDDDSPMWSAWKSVDLS